MRSAPEILAVRAVNQYRRRDVLAYLGLRLYLDCICSKRNYWSQEVAARIATYESNPRYHVSLHFKERNQNTGEIEYRRISLPTPNEIMAESALLAACGEARGPFALPECVYSYELATGRERRGIFAPYFVNFRKRHRDIARAAKQYPQGVVLYTDIRRFYPSITGAQATDCWQRSTQEARLPRWVEPLGMKLISGYAAACGSEESGILTGPMFSHLIGNLVLRDIDSEMTRALPGGYFRYVDDIALVGDEEDVDDAEERLIEMLDAKDYKVKSDKRFKVPAPHWLKSEDDFDVERHRVSWRTFVGGMKQLLIARPEMTHDIMQRLSADGFRITPLDYSAAVRERDYLASMRDLLNGRWFRRKMHHATSETTCAEALILRERYQRRFWDLVDGVRDLEDFDRKRRIHLLRRYASRLVYLADPSELGSIAEALFGVREMEQHAAVFESIDSGDIGRVVQYGANVAHSSAQALLSTNQTVTCSSDEWSEASRQARAVMIAHGITIDQPPPQRPSLSEQFCEWDESGGTLAEEPSTYFGELACLHGVDGPRRHEELLLTAFDVDEDMLVKIEDVLNESY